MKYRTALLILLVGVLVASGQAFGSDFFSPKITSLPNTVFLKTQLGSYGLAGPIKSIEIGDTSYTFNKDGQLTYYKGYGGQEYYAYDSDGKLLRSAIQRSGPPHSGYSSIWEKSKYTYETLDDEDPESISPSLYEVSDNQSVNESIYFDILERRKREPRATMKITQDTVEERYSGDRLEESQSWSTVFTFGVQGAFRNLLFKVDDGYSGSVTTYTYDSSGKLHSATDTANGEFEFKYDEQGRPLNDKDSSYSYADGLTYCEAEAFVEAGLGGAGYTWPVHKTFDKNGNLIYKADLMSQATEDESSPFESSWGGGPEADEHRYYTYTKFDKYSNWLQRKVVLKDASGEINDETTEVRKITYWS